MIRITFLFPLNFNKLFLSYVERDNQLLFIKKLNIINLENLNH